MGGRRVAGLKTREGQERCIGKGWTRWTILNSGTNSFRPDLYLAKNLCRNAIFPAAKTGQFCVVDNN